MLCVSIKPTCYELFSDQFKGAQDAASDGVVEIRLDALPGIDGIFLKDIILQSKVEILLTLRSERQGGEWSGTVEEHILILEQLAALGPDYIDVESDVAEKVIPRIKKRFPSVGTVLSYHNFQCTPDNMDEVLEGLQEVSADIYKIAVMANNTIDALRVLNFSKEAGKNVIALAMGKAGQVTRILGPVVKNRWTYASVSNKQTTAPGQITAEELKNRYNFDRLTPSTMICGLIGDPITYSISHIAHNGVYQNLEIDAVYVRMEVKSSEVSECLQLAHRLGFRGMSVTIPLKEKVQPYLKEIDATAEKMGAVNTLTFSKEGISGKNTDAAGAVDAIEQQRRVKGQRVVVIGAGGAARAVAYEAKRRGAVVTVLARRGEQAKKLGEDLGVEWRSFDKLVDYLSLGYDVIVNATPSERPIDEELILPETIVMDLKTKPRETAFLAAAKNKGCICVYGFEMFARQAVGQLQEWFGEGLSTKRVMDAFSKFSN